MDINKQTQQAGEGSQQIQATNVTIINNSGPTEEQVKKIVNDLIPVAIKEYTEEARETANERIAKLENCILPKISQVDGMIEAFREPAFQRLLVKAEQEAAVSEQDADYDLLTALLICHVQKGNNKKNRAGILKATEVVDLIDNNALCALTIMNIVEFAIPTLGDVMQGMYVLSDVYSKLEYTDLPEGIDWMEHLELLGAIRLSRNIKLNKFEDFYARALNGYACVGIRKESDNYKTAIELLKSIQIGERGLRDNILLDGYVRLDVPNKDYIERMILTDKNGIHKIRPDEKDVFIRIWYMYEKDDELQKKVNKNFMDMWDSFEPLEKIHKWWNSIPMSYDITQVGKILAHTNAKRCDPSLPDLL